MIDRTVFEKMRHIENAKQFLILDKKILRSEINKFVFLKHKLTQNIVMY